MKSRGTHRKKNGKGRVGHQYYRGRTAQTTNDRSRLRKQKEYRRANLSKQKRREVHAKIQRVGQWALVVLILGVIFNLMQIRSYEYIGLTGLTDADKEVVSTLTDEYIGGFNRFKTIFNETDYAAYIQENATFVSSVDTSSNIFSTTLQIQVVPKRAAHAFSQGDKSSSDTWIATDGSLIELTEDQLFQMGQAVPSTTIIDKTGVAYAPGDQITSVANLDYIGQFSTELSRIGLTVESIELLDTPREFRVQLAGEKYYLLTSFQRSIESTSTDLQAALKEIESANKPINEYVDLRVTDKVFYR